MEELVRVPLKLLNQSQENFVGEIFIMIGNKQVKISHNGKEFSEILHKYAKRGLMDIYVTRNIYNHYLINVKSNIAASKFFNPKTFTEKDRINQVSGCFELIKAEFVKQGVSAESLDMAQAISKNVLEIISDNPNIFRLYSQFKNNCSLEFLHCMLVSYTASTMIDNFDWSSAIIKEKCVLAILLCEITLDSDDIELMHKEKSPDHLPEIILKHPDLTARMLKKQNPDMPIETINIIEQHHEAPRGQGYPRGLNHLHISPLSAVTIVANEFIELLQASNFDYQKRAKIFEMLKEKYDEGHYAKAYEALVQVIRPF